MSKILIKYLEDKKHWSSMCKFEILRFAMEYVLRKMTYRAIQISTVFQKNIRRTNRQDYVN